MTETLATVWRVLTVVAKVYLWLYTRLVMVIAALPQNILMMLFGLTLSFFGGTYVATLAAAEAFRTVGGETLFKEVKYVWAQVQAVQEAQELEVAPKDLDDAQKKLTEMISFHYALREATTELKAVAKAPAPAGAAVRVAPVVRAAAGAHSSAAISPTVCSRARPTSHARWASASTADPSARVWSTSSQ